MKYIIGGLAVYKLMQFLNSMTPREAMPWVKVLVGIVLGYAVALSLQIEYWWTAGLVVATLASVSHGVLRCLTLIGDYMAKKTYK